MNKSTYTIIMAIGLFASACGNKVPDYKPQQESCRAARLSEMFIVRLYQEDMADSVMQELSAYDPNQLAEELNTEEEKLAFWINVYNGYIQVLAIRNTGKLRDDKDAFFTEKWIDIAGNMLSFDMIENGILRHSKAKFGLGYLPNLFPSSFVQRFRLRRLDWRIHFALNCGAKSCPPVRIFRSGTVGRLLDIATSDYLKTHVLYTDGGKKVAVPKLFLWFRGDFGGRSGMYRILHNYKIIPADKKPKCSYLDYNWTVDLKNFAGK